ncbi:uncharacterized protein TNCV_2524351 [Trichonephila clavipes]|nr:uncharacterized protein TNCV_2524351 [Trichonephila clavipes]
MITGGVKITPVLAMQLLCDLQPFTNIIEKNAAILFNRLIRLPNNSFWRDYDSDGGRNLKTQKGFIQCVRENIQYKVINDVPFELLSFANPLDYAILDIRLYLVLNVRKRDLSPTALHAIALETIIPASHRRSGFTFTQMAHSWTLPKALALVFLVTSSSIYTAAL